MSEIKEDSGGQNPPNPNTPKIPIKKGQKQVFSDETTTSNQQENKSENINGKRGEKWTKENWINALGVIVNAILVVIAIKALNSSNAGLKLTRETIERADSSFRIQNAPFLQVKDLRLSGDTMFYSIVNLGQYPVKIVSGKFGLQPVCVYWAGFNSQNPAESRIETIPIPKDYDPHRIYPTRTETTVYSVISDTTVINLYAIKETTITKFKVGFVQQSILKNEIKWEKELFREDQYFFGEIIYENSKLGINGSYVFNILISGWPNPTFQFILNDNR